MRKIIFLAFFGLLFFFTQAQPKKDSTSKKQSFIGLSIGGGIAWRAYNYNVPNDRILDKPQKGETPGLAYSVAFNYGRSKGRWMHLFGVWFDFAQYKNDSAIRSIQLGGGHTGFEYYSYSLDHNFVSLSYSLSYSFGKKKNWRAGMDIKAGWLVEYKLDYEYSDYKNKYDMEKNPTAWASIYISRKLFETKKLKLFVDVNASISSLVGYNTIKRNYYEPGPYNPYQQPTKRDYYESRPHYLLKSTLQVSLQYKL